jgi:hypothetical protein
MNDKRTVNMVIAFLGIISIIGTLGLIWAQVLAVNSSQVQDPALLFPIVTITTGAVAGMTALLANTNSSSTPTKENPSE